MGKNYKVLIFQVILCDRSCGYGTPVEEVGTMIFDLNTCRKTL